MDALFVATPDEVEIEEALRMWPELSGLRVRPLLVSAFGDIFVETATGEVWVASPIDLVYERVAASVEELERLFSNAAWAHPRLLTDVALLASAKGVERRQDQIFAIAPHPCLTGSSSAGEVTPMTLRLWHNIALQIRDQISQRQRGDPLDPRRGSP
jgi:hypothetical protein